MQASSTTISRSTTARATPPSRTRGAPRAWHWRRQAFVQVPHGVAGGIERVGAISPAVRPAGTLVFEQRRSVPSPPPQRLARCHAGLQQAGATPPAALLVSAPPASNSAQRQQRQPQQQPKPHLSILRRLAPRVFTHLDTAHLHAVSAAAFLLMSTAEVLRIIFCLASQGTLPPPEAPWAIQTAALISLAMAGTGFYLAHKHRRGVQRKGFMGAPVFSAMFTLGTLFYSGAFPMDSDLAVLAVRVAMLGLLPLTLDLNVIDGIMNGAAILEDRKDRHSALPGPTGQLVAVEVEHPGVVLSGDGDAHSTFTAAALPGQPMAAEPLDVHGLASREESDAGAHVAAAGVPSTGRSNTPPSRPLPTSDVQTSGASSALSWAGLVHFFSYTPSLAIPAYLSITFPLPIILCGAKASALMHARYPGSEDMLLHLMTIGLWAGATAAFAVTLRDRKLIGRSVEMAMVGLPFGLVVVVFAASLVLSEDGPQLMRMALDPVFLGRFVLEAWQL